MSQEKLMPAAVFTQGVATPKHDEMLLLFTKESERLKHLGIEGIREKIRKDFNYFDVDNKKFSLCIDRYGERKEEHICYNPSYDYTKILDCNVIDFFKYFSEIEIAEWIPEKAILGYNRYYIGSVDLYVKFKMTAYLDIKLIYKRENKEYIHNWEKFRVKEYFYEIVFEFKPEIKSYSETLRQVNVYKQHIPANYSIITYSDISKFQSIFESQGIKIYNP